MRRSMRIPRLIALIVSLGFVTAGSVGLGPAPHATGLTAGASVNVVIDELSPVAPKDRGTLRIGGRLANASPAQISDLRVRLRVSAAPINARDDIKAITSAPMDLTNTDLPNAEGFALDWTSTQVTTSLRPGGEATFQLAVPLNRLPLGRAGTYVLAVESMGRGPGDAFDQRQGIQRTFLPWFPGGASPELGVTWLWPLTDPPNRTATGTFLNDTTPTDFGPNGRLGRLVQLGAGNPVSWIADPSLLQAAASIGDGYQLERDGTLVVGDAAANGPTWLAALASTTTGVSPLHTLPYANVDATAVRRAGLATDVTQAITLGPRVAQSAINTSFGEPLAWTVGGAIDRQTSNLLVTSGVRTVVLRSDALTPNPRQVGIGSIGTIAGPLTAVIADDVLSDLASVTTPTNAQALAVRQQFLAHLAVIAAQASADEPRSVVIAPNTMWDPATRLIAPLLRATRTATWMTPQTLSQLLKTTPSPRQRVPYSQAAKQAELTPQYLSSIRREQSRLAALAAVLDDPTGTVEPFGQALLRAESSAWRAQPKAGAELLASIRRDLSSRTDAVHVLSRGSIVFSGDVGAVPVTIENDLDSAVTVGVELIGEPAARLSSTPLEGIRIEAGRRISVDLDARVIGGEPLPARVQLLTPDGQRYGTPGEITLSSTAYARAASWVVLAAFIAIAIFVVVGIARRIRKAQQSDASTSGPASPASSAGSGTLPT
jgi:hypothetical protein